jgi:hypothetical protein
MHCDISCPSCSARRLVGTWRMTEVRDVVSRHLALVKTKGVACLVNTRVMRLEYVGEITGESFLSHHPGCILIYGTDSFLLILPLLRPTNSLIPHAQVPLIACRLSFCRLDGSVLLVRSRPTADVISVIELTAMMIFNNFANSSSKT